MKARTIEILNLEFIKIGPRHRELREEQVSSLMQSIAKIGLKTPITVRQPHGDDDVYLVAGGHRLEACKRLGMEQIEAFVVESDDEDAARMWEIAENLHRAELTALERDEHVSEWIRLAEKKACEVQSLQDATNETKRSDGRGHRKESGVRAASRELGIESTDAHRAVKVASLSDDAKEAAKETGLDDNRSALLEAAKADPKRQAEKLREIARVKQINRQVNESMSQDDRQLRALHKAWDVADSDARARFLENIGVTSFVGVEL